MARAARCVYEGLAAELLMSLPLQVGLPEAEEAEAEEAEEADEEEAAAEEAGEEAEELPPSSPKPSGGGGRGRRRRQGRFSVSLQVRQRSPQRLPAGVFLLLRSENPPKHRAAARLYPRRILGKSTIRILSQSYQMAI